MSQVAWQGEVPAPEGDVYVGLAYGSCMSVPVCPRRSCTPVEGVSEQACGLGPFCVWGWHVYMAGCTCVFVFWSCAVHQVFICLHLSVEHLRDQVLGREKTPGSPTGIVLREMQPPEAGSVTREGVLWHLAVSQREK